MLEMLSENALAALIGALGGIVLGLASRLGRFCTLGAIEDVLYQGSSLRLRMWFLAIGVAMIASFLLIGAGLLVAEDAVYLAFEFNPLAAIFGGLVFGYGMALSGNCGFGALARLGGGDLRYFVIVLVMGISALVTISGPLAYLRVWIFPTPAADGPVPPGLAHLLSSWTGVSPVTFGLLVGAIFVVGALWSVFSTENRKEIFWAAMVGLAVASGWFGTQYIANHGFAATQVVTHTFSAPLGETILYFMTASGSSLNFGIGSVLGVLAGAYIGSLFLGHFRWEACEDPR
ncbi:MAG: YeeE/YedE family protein, partial [Paracoccaceae bacterium]|nr:YeeE/YedE family protein [Paracoccaceae bacterium]